MWRQHCYYSCTKPNVHAFLAYYRGSQNELLIEQEDQVQLASNDEIIPEPTEEVVLSPSLQRAHIVDLLRNPSLRTRSLILGLQW